MKKSLLALAVLGAFAGAAAAQSSVTIYGSVDLAVAKSNGGTAGNNGGPAGASKAWTLQQSNGNRLGFRGNEDLGGGLSAQFQIEHRFTADDGNQGAYTNFSTAPFWGGRSYVQLTSASAGSVYLGREYTPAFWPAVKSDPFGFDGVGQLGTMMWAGYTAPANPQGGVRSSNSVGYKSPKMGGLTFNGAIGLSETSGAGRNNGFNVEYGAGPIYAAMGYEKVTDGAADDRGLINFALHYDLGMAKVMGYYAKAEHGASASVAGTNYDSTFYSIAALAPMGSGNLKVAYARLDSDLDSVDRKKFAIGYDHRLSKRTNVYADLGLTRGTNLSSNNTFALGVKHTF